MIVTKLGAQWQNGPFLGKRGVLWVWKAVSQSLNVLQSHGVWHSWEMATPVAALNWTPKTAAGKWQLQGEMWEWLSVCDGFQAEQEDRARAAVQSQGSLRTSELWQKGHPPGTKGDGKPAMWQDGEGDSMCSRWVAARWPRVQSVGLTPAFGQLSLEEDRVVFLETGRTYGVEEHLCSSEFNIVDSKKRHWVKTGFLRHFTNIFANTAWNTQWKALCMHMARLDFSSKRKTT